MVRVQRVVLGRELVHFPLFLCVRHLCCWTVGTTMGPCGRLLTSCLRRKQPSTHKQVATSVPHQLVCVCEMVQSCAVEYIQKFTEHSPWHNKAVHYYLELLEHSDQEARVGACLALGQLGVRCSVPTGVNLIYSVSLKNLGICHTSAQKGGPLMSALYIILYQRTAQVVSKQLL